MTRTNFNDCTIAVYDRFGTTPVVDADGDLARASLVSFDTFYPGGLFGSAEIVVPRDPTRSWLFKQGQRLVIRNGLAVCFEGEIAEPGYYAGQGADGGRTITAIGFWGALLGTRGLDKPWCDTRLSEDAWRYLTVADGAGGAEKATVDRLNRIRLTPKAVAWTASTARVRYTAPTGQTIKRVTFNYDFQEAAQNWALDLYDPTGAASIGAQITSSGTGSKDETLGTPRQSVDLRLVSNAGQTPASDGTQYAEFSSIKVYTETGSINPTEIVKDWIGAISTLNSDTSQVASNTLTMEPWTTEGYEMAASNLGRLASFGDSSLNPWAAYVLESEAAATPNGEPVLALQQQPALSDYDYAVRLDDPNVSGELRLNKTAVYNWIVVTYTNDLGQTVRVTPDDDANLTDATSASETSGYGRREYVLATRFASQTAAVTAGRRFLAQHKDEHLYVSGPVTVTGYIRAKSGQPVPASLIRAGKRVKIENFLSDEVGVSGAGVTAIISATTYTDAAETCSISFGVPDDLAVLLARLAHFEAAGGRL